ncbi:hypothetical protein OAQ99_06045 [Candidatus Kapabacteria bacterium]|nr:hypothetical protein [Candidatus Kapabacteria bacterium]
MNKLALLITITIIFTLPSLALGPLKFGFQAGLSTPSEEITNVYNTNSVKFDRQIEGEEIEEVTGDLLTRGIDNGYHIGVNARISLGSSFSLVGSFAYHSFPEAKMDVFDPITDEKVVEFISSQRIVPVSAGIMFRFLELGPLEFYLRGEGQLNFISYETIFQFPITEGVKLSIPIASTESYSRLGAGFGGGFDIDLELFRLNIDVRYNIANLALTDSDEETKAYLGLGVGILF